MTGWPVASTARSATPAPVIVNSAAASVMLCLLIGVAVEALERDVDVALGVQRLRGERLAVRRAREHGDRRRRGFGVPSGVERDDVELLGLAGVLRAAPLVLSENEFGRKRTVTMPVSG